MDVQCEHCKIEYTLSDAVVSARGTPVRCTACGHQFKVYRADSDAEEAPEQWLVTTCAGQEFSFPTFRELQNAILAKHVLREDMLSRDRSPAQPLASIVELEPLFDRAPAPRTDGTSVLRSREAVAQGRARQHGEEPQDRSAAGAAASAVASSVPPRGQIGTLRPPTTGTAMPPQAISAPPAMTREESFPSPSYASETLEDVAAALTTPSPAPTSIHDAAAGSLPPTPRVLWRAQLPSDDELPEFRTPFPASEEMESMAPRRRVGGWIVALALLLAVGVVAWAAAKPYLTARVAGAALQLGPRAQSFLLDGEKAMADGNLDVAQENFDKASALAEQDPRVLLDEARVVAAKGDIPWLKLRLLAPDAKDELRTTNAALDELAGRAQQLAAKARASAPEDVAALRVEIDALRLAGERERARANVPRLMTQASQPETAYVLAALDLAEPQPVWATVIERLRLAAAGEGNAGRARAALIYALARSGDMAGANAELGKIDALARPYPLLPDLDAFVGKPSTRGVGSAPTAASVAASAQATPLARHALTPPSAGAEQGIGGDANTSMQWASIAIKKGDFSRAEQIYQALANRNPNDSEAISGLGDVARLTANPSGAMTAYRRAIAVNPSYLPALLGLADTEWSAGDRSGAIRGYNDIVDRFPEGTYPPYVSKRVNAVAPSAASPSPAPSDDAPAASDEHHE